MDSTSSQLTDMLRLTRYLSRVVRKTGYWFNTEQLLQASKEFLNILQSSRDEILSQGIISSAVPQKLLFFTENMGFHFPFSFVLENGALPSAISEKDLKNVKNSGEDLYSALFDFKIEALQMIIDCIDSDVHPSQLEELAFQFLKRIAAYPGTLKVLNMEIELAASGNTGFLSKYVNRTDPVCGVPDFFSLDLFQSGQNVHQAQTGVSFGVCGTVTVLLFLAKELTSRDIDSMYTGCTEVDPEFTFPIFHCFPTKLEKEKAQLLQQHNMNALTFLAEYNHWQEETREQILNIIHPDEEIEFQIPFVLKRSNFSEAQEQLKEFINRNKDLFNTGNTLYTLFSSHISSPRPPLEIEQSTNDNWIFRYKKHEISVPKRYKGAGYIALLVRHPKKTIPAYRLQNQSDEFEESLELMIQEAHIDEVEAYVLLDDLHNLEVEIRNYERDNHTLPLETVEKRNRLLLELNEKRDEAIKKDLKKSGDAVQKAIRRTIAFIEETYPELATYLELHVQTGTHLSFVM